MRKQQTAMSTLINTWYDIKKNTFI